MVLLCMIFFHLLDPTLAQTKLDDVIQLTLLKCLPAAEVGLFKCYLKPEVVNGRKSLYFLGLSETISKRF